MDILVPMPFVQGLVRAASLTGIAVDDVLAQEEIDLERTGGVPVSKVARLMHYLIDQSPFTTIFPMMRVMNDQAITEMLAVASSSRTLEQANQNIVKYSPVSVLGMNTYYEQEAEYDFFRISSHSLVGIARLLFIELCAASFIRFLPMQFPPEQTLLQVEFEFELIGNIEEYEQFFGCSVLFNQARNGIRVVKGVKDVEIRSFSPNLLAAAVDTLKEKTDVILALQGYRFQTIQVIQQAVKERIEAHKSADASVTPLDLSIAHVASKLGLNTRSLQRKLKQEETSYVTCKNQALIEESKNWMDRGQTNLDLIADTLGFSDRASFSKVFKKYEGIWPAQYR